MQLGAGARMFNANCQVTHIIELLDESYAKPAFMNERWILRTTLHPNSNSLAFKIERRL
jgi:hypothetical protein